MKNLNKLSRNDLKNVVGGGGVIVGITPNDPVTCHYTYTESSNGTQTITGGGSGASSSKITPGSHCHTYTAMGGSCSGY